MSENSVVRNIGVDHFPYLFLCPQAIFCEKDGLRIDLALKSQCCFFFEHSLVVFYYNNFLFTFNTG